MIKKNITKFYIISFFFGFVFFYAIDKILMESRGLTITDMIIVEIVYVVCVILFEVPSGAIADRWSRKYMIALNFLFFIIYTITWALAPNLGIFALGAFIASLHSTFMSGTYSSIVYDTLKQIKREQDYEKMTGRMFFYTAISAAVAPIVGSMFAEYINLTIPFWLTIPFIFIAMIISLTLEEPKIHRTTGEVSYWKHIRKTGQYLWKKPQLIYIVSLTVLLLIILNFIDEYSQIYFVKIGIPIFFLGYLAAAAAGVEALGVKYAYKLKKMKRSRLYAILLLINTLGLFAIGYFQSFIGVIIIFVPILITYIACTLLSGDFHRQLPSSQRATSESFVGLLRALFIIPVAFTFSYIADNHSLFDAYIALGVLSLFFMIFFVIGSRNELKNA